MTALRFTVTPINYSAGAPTAYEVRSDGLSSEYEGVLAVCGTQWAADLIADALNGRSQEE